MGADVMKYISLAFGAIILYLLLVNASNTSKVISSLSGFNTNAILALQGRSPTASLG